MDLNAVAALPYLFLVAASLFLVLFQVIAFCLGGGSHDTDVHHDIDHDFHHDVSHDVHHDMHHDVHHDHHPGLLTKILSTVMVGSSVPFLVVMYVLSLSCGLTGLAVSLALAKFFTVANWFLLVTAPISCAVSLLTTRSIVRRIAPLFQMSGQAETLDELVGKTGRVSSIQIDHQFGEIVVPINGVPEHVIAKTDGETIQRDDSIVVMGIDQDTQRPIVTRIRN